jgi:hypothetical protein
MTTTKHFVKVEIYMDPQLKRKIKEICDDHEVPISFWIRELLEEKVKEEKIVHPSVKDFRY